MDSFQYFVLDPAIMHKAIEEAKFKLVHSCCGVYGKNCSTDMWQGNIYELCNTLYYLIQKDEHERKTLAVQPKP